MPWGASSASLKPSQYNGPTAVSAEVSGLTTETTYHYRVVVTNASGTRTNTAPTRRTPPIASSASPRKPQATSPKPGRHAEWFAGRRRGATPTTTSNGAQRLNTGRIPPPSPPEPISVPIRSQPDSADGVAIRPNALQHLPLSGCRHEWQRHQLRRGPDVNTTPVGIPSIPSLVRRPGALRSDAPEGGEFDPNGADTSYHFEYVPAAEFGEIGLDERRKDSGHRCGHLGAAGSPCKRQRLGQRPSVRNRLSLPRRR